MSQDLTTPHVYTSPREVLEKTYLIWEYMLKNGTTDKVSVYRALALRSDAFSCPCCQYSRYQLAPARGAFVHDCSDCPLYDDPKLYACTKEGEPYHTWEKATRPVHYKYAAEGMVHLIRQRLAALPPEPRRPFPIPIRTITATSTPKEPFNGPA